MNFSMILEIALQDTIKDLCITNPDNISCFENDNLDEEKFINIISESLLNNIKFYEELIFVESSILDKVKYGAAKLKLANHIDAKINDKDSEYNKAKVELAKHLANKDQSGLKFLRSKMGDDNFKETIKSGVSKAKHFTSNKISKAVKSGILATRKFAKQ
jgi:hypothetical protein